MERKHGTGWRAEARATLGLAWPLALTNLSQHALALTDAIILGWLSTEALAAATLGANLYWALMAPALGTALAAGPILAQARGHGQRAGHGRGWVRQMRRGARSALVAALILLVPSLLSSGTPDRCCAPWGRTRPWRPRAGTYVRAMMWGLIPFCGFIVLRGFLAAMERPGRRRWPSPASRWWRMRCSAGCWSFGASAAGPASASSAPASPAASPTCSCSAACCWWWRATAGSAASACSAASGGSDPARLREVFRIGLPISGQMLLEIGVFSAAALAMGGFGAVAVAAHAIALQTAAMTFMVPMGIGQAATARVGLLAGAGDAGRRRGAPAGSPSASAPASWWRPPACWCWPRGPSPGPSSTRPSPRPPPPRRSARCC